MIVTRAARVASAAVVAGVAAIASYSHMRDLAAEHGQGPLLANLLPVSVDGMLIVASAVTADDRAADRRPRLSARVSFVVGVVASIVANVLAAPPDPVARVISAWPALALLLVVEMLSGGGRHAEVGQADVGADSPDGGAVKTPPASGPGRPSAAGRVLAARQAAPAASVAEVARQAGVSARTARRHLNEAAGG
ncbi:DUF2637 domain-containing protein [Micromonospora sp. NPDC047707]|uniref:DUF2637 domain-containing protein n=1 Tax=Micromonospora sp. NPDC047707 TaxID=3154498 RepID=UPI00345162D3